MSCIPHGRSRPTPPRLTARDVFREFRVLGPLIAVAATLATASTSSAQQPTTTIPIPPAPYHAPMLVLSQPADGGALPSDKPVAVFRFTAGEATDPVDALSFSIAVDGVDRTTLFELTTTVVNGLASGEAWGAIEDPSPNESGPHDVRARVCSMRGTCAFVHASLSLTSNEQALAIMPNAARVAPSAPKNVAEAIDKHRTRAVLGILDKVLQAVHVLSR